MIFKEEMRIDSSTDDDQVLQETLNTEGTILMEEANMRRAKVKMEEVREENERLKLTLSQMMRDYHSLKMQFTNQSKKPTTLNLASMAESSDNESELVSLSLGRFSADSRREEVEKKRKKKISYNNDSKMQLQQENDGLTELGLNWKLNSDNSSEEEVSRNNLKENSSDESKEEEDVRSSHKNNSKIGDEEILQHNPPLKKPRVSVRAVCNTQTMHDGCQWRKYGQKIAKGNPCPRAYYRCTVSSSCPVRKQVQRCIDDMSILVTTYEGSHNHPLSASATTMASATSAAVAMLSCGSRSTASPPPPSLFGLNNSSSSTNINNINFPRATISSSQSHPTVILDLTAPNHNNKYSSTSTIFSTAPTSLNFSSFDPNKFPAINNVLTPPSYNMINSQQPPLFPSLQKLQAAAANDHKIAAATKAITHDPTFQSALAAAITSFVGNNNNGHGRSSSGMNFHLNFSQPPSTTSNAGIGCAASFMNRFPQPVINSQQKNLTHFAPLTLSASKPQTMSLADEGEQINI